MKYLQSPLNYTGGKFKLLPQIEPLFPKQIDTFVDLFCGGGNVGANVSSSKVIFNDTNRHVISILKSFSELDEKVIFEKIMKIIDEYGLSLVSDKGYGYYGCDSQNGLGKYNKDPYIHLRNILNHKEIQDADYYIMLYVLIIYTFNNQIRFNKHGEFNLPVGKRDFNATMQKKLSKFINKLHSINCKFSHKDFRDINIESLSKKDFVYADPPYLITCATYNENGGWTTLDEQDLYYKYLDRLNERGIRFALSNVLFSKGKSNEILKNWLDEHSNYNCHHLNYNYANSNYHTSGRNSITDEIVVTNY